MPIVPSIIAFSEEIKHIIYLNYTLNHTQLALVLFSQLLAAVVRHKANDCVVCPSVV